MHRAATQTLYDPRNGDLALAVADLIVEPGAGVPSRTNTFHVDWLQDGRGHVWADCACHPVAAPALVFATPYQYRRYVVERPVRGERLEFHANFLCIETYHDEVGCNGVLFNDVYGVPVVTLDDRHNTDIGELIGQVRRELTECGLAHAELLLSYLKVLLIRATRLKLEQQPGDPGPARIGRLPPVLEDLRALIEANYRHLHAPAEYARLLETDLRALGRVVKAHLHRTLTELIRERILKHARWELLHTLKPVKQVARELGYTDELYFSRVFKRATGFSPLAFREYETAIRGGRNLSMVSPLPSIPESPSDRDDEGHGRVGGP